MNLEEITPEEEQAKTARSYKLLLIFAMVSMVMVFAGLTSALVVSKSREDWLKNFDLPIAFYWSTAILIISSFTFHFAKIYIKKDDKQNTTKFLFVTLFLGLLFIYLQYEGFHQLFLKKIYPVGSIFVSFLWVIVITHIIHLFAGIISLLIIIYKHLKDKYNSTQLLGIELGTMFWHFLDILWIYLFLFLIFFK